MPPPESSNDAPGRITVWPVPVCVPPDQVNEPVTLRVSSPPTVPPDCVIVPVVAGDVSKNELRLKLTTPPGASVRPGML